MKKIIISFLFSHRHANIIDLTQYKKIGGGGRISNVSTTMGTRHRKMNDALFIAIEEVTVNGEIELVHRDIRDITV